MDQPNTIIITTTHDLWNEAKTAGKYEHSTIDTPLEDVGFIHATFPDQTIAMINRNFKHLSEVLLLLVDTRKISSSLKIEAPKSDRSGMYPHIYSPLSTDAVYQTIELHASDGVYKEPDELRTMQK